MEFEELQIGYQYGMHRIYEMVVNCCGLATKVLTKRGRIDARDVRIGDEIMGPSGWRDVVYTEVQKPSRVRRLKFDEFATETICTENHKWRCLRDGEMQWVETKDLIPGDLIFAGGRYDNFLKSPAKIEWNKEKVWEETRPNIRNRLLEINAPSEMTVELAELMGILAGDGSTGVRLASNTISVYIHESLIDYKKHVGDLFYKVLIHNLFLFY